MKRKLFKFIYHRILGWKAQFDVEIPDKCVICAAPHTSNWDLFMGKVFYAAYGNKVSFMMKKEWFFFPLGLIFKAMGGIPVERNKKMSLVEQMTQVYNQKSFFHLAITPEATRKPNSKWKKGFYFIAQGAQVPIILIGLDYGTKTIYVGEKLIPSGDVDQDMRRVNEFFKDFKGKHPENFLLNQEEE